MNSADTFTLQPEPGDNAETESVRTHYSLRESVEVALRHYFKELDGQPTTDLYQLVISEVEGPLLEAVLDYTRCNQSRAAEMLGLNRGTLRKKLKQHDLL